MYCLDSRLTLWLLLLLLKGEIVLWLAVLKNWYYMLTEDSSI